MSSKMNNQTETLQDMYHVLQSLESINDGFLIIKGGLKEIDAGITNLHVYLSELERLTAEEYLSEQKKQSSMKKESLDEILERYARRGRNPGKMAAEEDLSELKKQSSFVETLDEHYARRGKQTGKRASHTGPTMRGGGKWPFGSGRRSEGYGSSGYGGSGYGGSGYGQQGGYGSSGAGSGSGSGNRGSSGGGTHLGPFELGGTPVYPKRDPYGPNSYWGSGNRR